MARFRCLMHVVDDDGLHEPGEIIELTPAQGSKALLESGAVERARARKKAGDEADDGDQAAADG